MPLKSLLDDVKDAMGIQHKSDIQIIAKHLQSAYHNPFYPNGDDTAVIPTKEGYDLFSGEGFLEEFVQKDPWFAGWCGVMVNISDITSMGGRPTAVINSYWGKDDEITAKVFAGLSAASNVFNVPVVGGHTNLRADKPQLAVSILGKAKNLLSSFNAKPGQTLIAAIDCRGGYRAPFNNWNAATDAPPERLRADLELLPSISDESLATACKDISQAGLLGTCLMMLESSEVGAVVDLDKIPKPKNIPWQQWLCSFPSFGYLLTADNDKAGVIINRFKKRGISCADIGHITSHQSLIVKQQSDTENFWNLEKKALTTMGKNKPSKINASHTPDIKNITNHQYLRKSLHNA